MNPSEFCCPLKQFYCWKKLESSFVAQAFSWHLQKSAVLMKGGGRNMVLPADLRAVLGAFSPLCECRSLRAFPKRKRERAASPISLLLSIKDTEAPGASATEDNLLLKIRLFIYDSRRKHNLWPRSVWLRSIVCSFQTWENKFGSRQAQIKLPRSALIRKRLDKYTDSH